MPSTRFIIKNHYQCFSELFELCEKSNFSPLIDTFNAESKHWNRKSNAAYTHTHKKKIHSKPKFFGAIRS